MKNAKILTAILLVVLMTMAFATTAFAAEGNTLTITGAKNNHVFSAYQLFSGTYNSTSGELESIDWGTGFDSASVSGFIGALKTKFTDNTAIQALDASDPVKSSAAAVAQALASITSDSDDAAALAEIFVNYITGSPATSTQTAAPYTITGLEDGYYIVRDSSTFEGDADMISDYIMKIVASVEVPVKGSIPTVDKKVSTDGGTNYEDGNPTPVNVQIGDILDYEIIGTLPSNYSDYVKYYMEFRDTVDSVGGDIALKTGSTTYGVFVDNEGTLTEVKADCYIPTVTVNSLNVKIADTKSLKDTSGNAIPTTKDSKIVVKYQAEVLSTTTPGTPDTNTADIVYSKDPNWDGTGTPETGETPPDVVETVTQSFVLVKYDGANDKLLAGATFQILKGTTPINLVKVSDTVYKVADSDDTPTVTSFTTVSTTTPITVKGLDADVTYTLRETAAPVGYNAAADTNFSVSADTTTAAPVISAQGVYDTENPDDEIAIENNSGTVLPATGGMGTVLFITVGAIVAMATGVVLTAKKRLYNEG